MELNGMEWNGMEWNGMDNNNVKLHYYYYTNFA
jgi:hypothetical protein